ncbi:MAG: xanthine dehydrogenase family protein molybdopterin-binding subunit [Candidatus Caldarchaeum sp.]|nr:xanthine dehydrogenase family protein molybdopterin-binding subunit [Candidatus Caldarchaeum sp.]
MLAKLAMLAYAEKYRVIGKSVPKVDGNAKIRGAAHYVDDLELPNMLYGKILRSRYAHARIVRINTEKAWKVPGVRAVITGYDTKMNSMGILQDQPPLKTGKVRSVRDEVAAVAAETPEAAEEAVEAVEVEYEPLEGVFDPEEALKPGSPLVHEEYGSNAVDLKMNFTTMERDSFEQVFEKAAAVVSDRYQVHYMNASPLGTMGVVAHFNETGELVVYTNTQAPFLYRHELAKIMGFNPAKIRVIQPEIGGAFGRGMDVYPLDPITAALSVKTRRPVKLIFSREEELQYAPPRQPAVVYMRTAADRGGRLLAREARVVLDAGAYVSWGPFDGRVMMATVSGLYDVPHVFFDAKVVYTNNPYTGTQRGAGNPQITFAIEQQMDALAEELGMDPVELRILNANKPNSTTPQGMKITTCELRECLRKAAELIGWRGRGMAGPNRGIGFGAFFHVGGGARVYRSDGCGTILSIDDFGLVTVITGSTDLGTGSDTAIAQIVAEELGVEVSNIRVVNDDASIRPWDVGTHASRATFVAGNSALLAARKAKEILAKAAAQELQTTVEKLVFEKGVVYDRDSPSKRIEFDKLVRRIHFRQGGSNVVVTAYYDPPTEMQDERWMGNLSAAYVFGAQAALVEVDPETKWVKVLKVVSVHDSGRILNPAAAEGQVHGGVVMGIGYTLYEELVLEQGRVVNASLMDYLLPTSAETPEIKAVFIETPDPAGPFGAKGIGETGCIPTAAAIANAVYDATGKRVKQLPVKPERLFSD